MKGVIAAGDVKTAEAGAEILRVGGNAFDATLAAMLAAPLCEPVFTSLGGGGFLLATEENKDPILYDFFVDVPPKEMQEPEFFPVYIDFKTAIQEFHIGCGSAAVPGMIKGIWQMYQEKASLPLEQLIQPALRYAREGIYLSKMQASFIKLLEPIFTSTRSCQELYAKNGVLIDETHLFKNPDYANFLERFAREGDALFYEGDVAQSIHDLCAQKGGLITKKALQKYCVHKRKPIRFSYEGYDVYTNPPPSSGGILIAFSLMMLEKRDLGAINSRKHMMHFIESLKITTEFRKEHVDAYIHQTNLEEILTHKRLLDNFNISMQSRLNLWGNTTHISVMDEAGNATSVTTTNGEACGHIIPGTGILLNNMLGEEDLNPHGFFSWPQGVRLPSMMAPTALSKNGKPEMILGSAGSNRIRSAILNTIVGYTHFDQNIQEAISAPRVHLDKDVVYMEPGFYADPNEIAHHYELKKFDELNLFFGGVQGVTHALEGGADPRRGAHVIQVK